MKPKQNSVGEIRKLTKKAKEKPQAIQKKNKPGVLASQIRYKADAACKRSADCTAQNADGKSREDKKQPLCNLFYAVI